MLKISGFPVIETIARVPEILDQDQTAFMCRLILFHDLSKINIESQKAEKVLTLYKSTIFFIHSFLKKHLDIYTKDTCKMLLKCWEMAWKNIVAKRENAGNQHFLTMFSKCISSDGMVLYRTKNDSSMEIIHSLRHPLLRLGLYDA